MTGTATGPSARQLGLRLRAPLVLAGLVLLATVLIGLAQSQQLRGELDPDATDPSGSRALRVLLEQQQIPVRRVAGAPEARVGGVAEDAGTVVLVAFPNRIPTEALRSIGSTPYRVVAVAPDAAALSALTDDVRPSGSAPVVARSPGCAAPPAVLAGEVDLGGRTYQAHPDTAEVCYGGTFTYGRTHGGGPLVVIGSVAPLTNERLGQRGNAALALAALGAGDTDKPAVEVRWLLTQPGQAGAGQAGLLDVLPGWVPLAAVQLLVGGFLVALWRGRRLGPVVAEPLPVVVRAAETVEGRSRLYRRVRATGRAADALRAGTLARVVPRVGIGVAPRPEAVVAAVARRAGQPEPVVATLLYGPPPVDDAALVRLADALDGLERAALR
ncbi:MAG: DUF4350 domain-containing protein [Actinobacteria bacterium]|nr:DUF4350 domain-containing protein [Actinomycetota bacterium]MBI3687828.1 DUF4350 domain-containing protein [Actinomycetota bacterium]